ncbi:MAG: BsuPI-related putative proteinase inhibitor [TACK group archaeon]|nr:BsuPI-related putative proteinase inhibitor [TACK group archaeon]
METKILGLFLMVLVSVTSGYSLAFGPLQNAQLTYGASYSATPSGVTFTIYVDNPGSVPVTVYASQPLYSVSVYSNGQLVWSSSYGKVYAMGMSSMVIAPYKVQPGSTQWIVVWNYTDNQGNPVAPGTYYADVYALGVNVGTFTLQVGTASSGSLRESGVSSWGSNNNGVVIMVKHGKKMDEVNFNKFSVANFTKLLVDINASSGFAALASNAAVGISEGFNTQAPGVDRVFVINAAITGANSAPISFYRFDNRTKTWSEVTLPAVNLTALMEHDLLSQAKKFEANLSLNVNRLNEAALSGNAATFEQAIDEYLRNVTVQKKQVWAEISLINSQGESRAMVIEMLQGAIHLNLTVERQFEITEKMGLTVSNAAKREYKEGLGNLTLAESTLSPMIQPGGPMIPANSAATATVNSAPVTSQNLALAVQYVRVAMKDFQEALVLNAQSRAGPKPETPKLQAAWAVENATANLLKNDPAATQYIEQAKADLNAAALASNQAQAQQLITDAMHELELALQTYPGSVS